MSRATRWLSVLLFTLSAMAGAEEYGSEDIPVETVVPATVWCANCDMPSLQEYHEEKRWRASFNNTCIQGWQTADSTNRHPCYAVISLSLMIRSDTPVKVCMKSIHEVAQYDNPENAPCRWFWFEPNYDSIGVSIPTPVGGYDIERLRTFTIRTIRDDGTPVSWTYPALTGRLPAGPPFLPYPAGHFLGTPFCASQSVCNVIHPGCIGIP